MPNTIEQILRIITVRHFESGEYIFRYMADHHADDMRRMERFIHTDARSRLVHTLLDLGDRLGYAETEFFELAPSYTHEDLANMIGVVRSTVSDVIGQLRREGV